MMVHSGKLVIVVRLSSYACEVRVVEGVATIDVGYGRASHSGIKDDRVDITELGGEAIWHTKTSLKGERCDSFVISWPTRLGHTWFTFPGSSCVFCTTGHFFKQIFFFFFFFKMSCRSWCYTVNNYTEGDVAQFEAFICKRHRCCKEVGDNGTPHLQGFITFTRTYRLSGLKKLNKKAHWEPAQDHVASLNYCTKGIIVIDINNSSQGKRTDLDTVCDCVIEGKRLGEIALENPKQFVKFNSGIQKLKYIADKEKATFEFCDVTVITGVTRTGKTRLAYEIDKGLFNLPCQNGDALWFDGYDGEKTLLIDDYKGRSIRYEVMLRICDGHPNSFPVKGGHIVKKWNHVIITSNDEPSEWWGIEDIDAFTTGRITKHIHL